MTVGLFRNFTLNPGVAKQNRLYVGNNTVHNSQLALAEINEVYTVDSEILEKVAQRINSYLGYFGQYASYAIRYNFLKQLNGGWFQYLYISNRLKKVTVKKRYKKKEILKNNIIKQRLKTY